LLKSRVLTTINRASISSSLCLGKSKSKGWYVDVGAENGGGGRNGALFGMWAAKSDCLNEWSKRMRDARFEAEGCGGGEEGVWLG
jgi:hypothetical protein